MDPITFITALRFEHIPTAALDRARLCLLDLLGVAAAGTSTELSRIVRRHATRHMGAGGEGVPILFDGRPASPAGAAYAAASTIDSFDAHDGHALTKGHAGVAILPACLAFAEAESLPDGREWLVRLVLGYEIATRAGIALHGTVSDYHTSGAWNALGCAAIGARALGLTADQTRHALGIAEYHGPRSQMMRCIDHPTMLKDGSGWGAFAGVTAAYLAEDGFTGAPAITLDEPAFADLGTRWTILEQYFKPHPVCRWAQPAIEAVANLRRERPFAPQEVEAVEIRTFAHAVALGTRAPVTTEEAQYAIGFPVAAILARSAIGAAEIAADGLADPAIREVLGRIRLVEEPAFSARFPAERLASVAVTLRSGETLASGPTGPRGDPASPLPEAEIRAKFHALASALPAERRAAIEDAVSGLGREPETVDRLLGAVADPLPEARGTRIVQERQPALLG